MPSLVPLSECLSACQLLGQFFKNEKPACWIAKRVQIIVRAKSFIYFMVATNLKETSFGFHLI
jgi:hypothetical protein